MNIPREFEITDDDRMWVATQYAICRTTPSIIDDLLKRKDVEDTPENRKFITGRIQTAQPTGAKFSKKYKDVYEQVRNAWKKGIQDHALYHRSGRIRFYDSLLKVCEELLEETKTLDTAERVKSASSVIRNMESIVSGIRNDGDVFEAEDRGNDEQYHCKMTSEEAIKNAKQK